MTNSKNPKTVLEMMTNGAGAMPEAGEQFEAFWRAQAAAAKHMQSFFDDWCERRREAAEAAADCCAEVVVARGDMGVATKAFAQWSQDEVARLNKDAVEQSELVRTLASDAMKVMSNGAGKKTKAPGHKAAKPKQADAAQH